jgi:tetratricopeptide (TPR) repeat protein
VHAQSPPFEAIVPIQQSWAHITYEMPKAKRANAYQALEAKAAELAQENPSRAEPLVWEAIILSTHAGVEGGLGGLGMARDARRLLLEAQRLDPEVMQGSIYTTLGALYYQVPGWPLGFGDKDKAREMLQKAVSLNPTGMDANYFYGDFLYRAGDKGAALVALRKAVSAPPRTHQPVADRGRREAAQALIDTIAHGS